MGALSTVSDDARRDDPHERLGMTERRSRVAPRAATALLAAGALIVSPLIAPAATAATLPIVDDFEAPLVQGASTADGVPLGFFPATDPSSSTTFERTTAPPAPVPGAADPNHVLKGDFTVSSFGVIIHTFEDPTATQWITQDWSASEGMQFWLYGQNSGTDLFIDVIDNRPSGSTTDNAERFTAAFADDFSGWKLIQLPFEQMTRKDIGNGAPNDGFGLTEIHGWAFGTLATGGTKTYYIDDISLYGVAPERPLTVGFSTVDTQVVEGATATVEVKLSKASDETVTVDWATTTGTATPDRDYVPASGTVTFDPGQTRATLEVATIDDLNYQGERGVVVQLSNPTVAEMGKPGLTRVLVKDNESFDPSLVDDFEMGAYFWDGPKRATITTPEIASGDALEVPGQGDFEQILSVKPRQAGNVEATRTFAAAQDWSSSAGIQMRYYGTGKGQKVTVGLDNNDTQPSDADPATWELAWSDEFNTPAGTSPNPDLWTPEIGDGTIIGKPGWGNDELQYYTDDPENVATDGEGNLVITTRATDPETAPLCYYGPCKYTSARLVTQDKVEFQYGRIEGRAQVPVGSGLWPALWALGNDINRNPWPASGEIDIMENVGRNPNTVFGTIHGPGYSGGQSFGGTYDFDVPVADEFHTFAVEWAPGEITWSVDGIEYHDAAPADVDPNQWVFEHPFFLILNVAVGGNFGGAVGANTTFPQELKVDYVRVYQPVERPIEFTATFRDTVAGWSTVTVPFSDFTNEDGATLDLTDVRSLSLSAQVKRGQALLVDEIRLACADTMQVTTDADSGAGSLRAALGAVCSGGTVEFDASLAGATIATTSELTLGKAVTIDASDAPGVAISGQGTHRALVVEAGVTATVRGVTLRDGYGYDLAGGVLNNGSLTLEDAVVEDNLVTTGGIEFWKGGAGVYTGDGGTLVLRDSTVRDNTVTGGAGGGIYGFFNSTVTIERSTVSGNSTNDVGGGIRSLGNTTIVNSTISGNVSTGWHGGGLFHTDGTVTVVSSTITANTAPGGNAGGAFFGSFGALNGAASLSGSIISGNSGDECIVFYGGPFAMQSLGFNVLSDGTCGVAAATDKVVADALLGQLADNGGPTLTHALLAGSPAIDVGDPASTLATDQRGVTRPQGAAPDAGAFERD
jgi:beta-glucanase (GH16 family)